jgi:hypothetical protein
MHTFVTEAGTSILSPEKSSGIEIANARRCDGDSNVSTDSEQFAKQFEPRVSIDDGIVTLSRRVQLLNASGPSSRSLDPDSNLTSDSKLHLWKQEVPIFSRELGR